MASYGAFPFQVHVTALYIMLLSAGHCGFFLDLSPASSQAMLNLFSSYDDERHPQMVPVVLAVALVNLKGSRVNF